MTKLGLSSKVIGVEGDKLKSREEEKLLVQYYRKNNIFIQQIKHLGCIWANTYTLTDGDYRIGMTDPQSEEAWLAQGFEQTDKQELIDGLGVRGYGEEIIL